MIACFWTVFVKSRVGGGREETDAQATYQWEWGSQEFAKNEPCRTDFDFGGFSIYVNYAESEFSDEYLI